MSGKEAAMNGTARRKERLPLLVSKDVTVAAGALMPNRKEAARLPQIPVNTLYTSLYRTSLFSFRVVAIFRMCMYDMSDLRHVIPYTGTWDIRIS